MDNLLLNLLIALVGNELIHNCFEIWGIRQKVHWLNARMESRPHSDWPINIDTDAKAYGLHFALLLGVSGLFFILLLLINLPFKVLVLLGISLLLVSYILTTLNIHKFHLEIGRLLRRFKRH